MTNIKDKLEGKLKDSNVVPLNPNTASTPEINFCEAQERLEQLQRFVKESFVKGVDYGIIPGFPKPSLFKPGAEKLCELYGLAKKIQVTHRIEDIEKPFFLYEVKVTLINKRTGEVEGEGIGSSNSQEKMYTKDPIGKSNNMVKIASKRALIDAIITITRISSIFPQDIEDMGDINMIDKPATQKQLTLIYKLAEEKKLTNEKAREILKEVYAVDASSQLTSKQADEFIRFLRD
jgi:hypothetical protein